MTTLPDITPELFRDAEAAKQVIGAIELLNKSNPAAVTQFCLVAITHNANLSSAYRVLAKSLLLQGDQASVEQVAAAACRTGLFMANRGDIAGAAAFFADVARALPDPCAPYAELFGQISTMTTAYRSMAVAQSEAEPRRRVLVSLSIWGKPYVDLFVRYFVPSILAPGNVPALREIREIHFDISTTAEDLEAIRDAPSVRELRKSAQIQFIRFSRDILTSREYASNTNLRYRVFGAFHHLSIERARALGADVICIAPDCVFSDGAFTNYVRFVDDGYQAVFLTALRAQAEMLMPILDGLRDERTCALAVGPRKLVEMNIQHIHHAHKGFVLVKGNRDLPQDPSVLYFPHTRGFYVRCLHIHPIVLSAEVIKKEIAFDYWTVDMNSLSRFFPTPEDCAHIKVLDDSDDGFMLDLAYKYGAPGPVQNREFTLAHLLERAPNYLPHHFWAFQHRINFHCDAIDAAGSYDRLPDGSLRHKPLPAAEKIDISDEEVAAWLESNRPKEVPPKVAPKP